jgi:hypothetical protein
MSTPLSFEEYERIHQVLRALMDGTDSNTAAGCRFFAAGGAAIIREHLQLDAALVSGSAFLCTETTPLNGVCVSSRTGDTVATDSKNFHCWIECQGYFIDFMAPVFREANERAGHRQRIPRRMFQRPITSVPEDPWGFRRVGDFYYGVNPELTEVFRKEKAMGEQLLTDAALAWFTHPPAPIAPTYDIPWGGGSMRARIRPSEINGAWGPKIP